MYLVCLEVQDCEEGIGICLVAVDLDCASECWLRQDEVCEF